MAYFPVTGQEFLTLSYTVEKIHPEATLLCSLVIEFTTFSYLHLEVLIALEDKDLVRVLGTAFALDGGE